MRLTRKKVKDLLMTVLGEEFVPLLEELYGKEKVSEFDLADVLKEDIKVIRKRLYTLYNHNFVAYDRKKDKIKGWYIYYWTLIPENVKFTYVQNKKKLLKKLQEKLGTEQNELFYVCPNDCVRLNFDESLEYEFHCPECGELITQDDSAKRKKVLSEKIEELKEELKAIEIEQEEARQKVLEKIKKQEELDNKKTVKKKVVKKKIVKKKVAKKKTVKKKVVKKTAKKIVKKKVVKKKTVKKKK